MTIRECCPNCKEKKTTKNSVLKGRNEFAPGVAVLWFNCKVCDTTFTLGLKKEVKLNG